MLQSHISRRRFMQGLCASGLVLGLPSLSLAERGTFSETRLLMGTIVNISLAQTSKMQAEEGFNKAFNEMQRLIAIFDRHQGSTALGVLNAQGRLQDCPPELLSVVEQAQIYSRQSGNVFDMTVLPVLEAFTASAVKHGQVKISDSELKELLKLVDAQKVQVSGGQLSFASSGMSMTLDGIAKGYIVDQAARILETAGIKSYLINAGGDIRCGGEKRPRVQWTVAVEDPAKQRNYPDVIKLNGAIATSGSYERRFDSEHHHLISPQSGHSPQNMVSVSVKAPTAMEADVLATTLSLFPVQIALSHISSLPGRECLIIDSHGKAITSKGWS